MKNLYGIPLLALLSIALISCDSGPGPNEEPTVSISFSPQNPRAGSEVSFEANATDPDGSIENYEWSFGDGSSAIGQSVTHAFDEKGSLSVSVTVTDERDGTNSASRTIDVQQRYSQAEVTEVEVQDMPLTTSNGAGWDSFSGPDPFYAAGNVDDEVHLVTSSYYQDVSSSDFPFTYSGASFTVSDLSKEFGIELWDSDNTEHDFITSVSFTLESLIGDYPDSHEVQSSDLEIVLHLNWKE